MQVKADMYHSNDQEYLCDGTHRNAVAEVLTEKDASRNGVAEPFSWHRYN